MVASALIAVRVARKTREAQDICSLDLIETSGNSLPSFSAGSHIDVHLPGGLVRQYSLCNAPDKTHGYQISVLKTPDSRGGSKAVHETVSAGDVLTISPPKNHFPLAHAAQRHLLIAGGIGITPILCMAEQLSTTRADFTLHYCTRSRINTAFYDRIRQSAFARRVHFHFDDGAQKLNLAETLKSPVAGAHLYVCGPQGFMDAVLNTARAAGWTQAQLHYEAFSNTPTRAKTDTRFQIQLASSGQVLTVPANQSVVDVLYAAGVVIPTSCRQGVCGTCLTRVLEGEPDHRDVFLTPEEQAANDQFTPCCSRAKSARLVLDV